MRLRQDVVRDPHAPLAQAEEQAGRREDRVIEIYNAVQWTVADFVIT